MSLKCSLCENTLQKPKAYNEFTDEEFASGFTGWLKAEYGWKCSDCKLKDATDKKKAAATRY
jgi:hypothetical protein